MIEKGKISSRQFYFLIFCLLLSNSLYNLPTSTITSGGRDVWQVWLVALGIDVIAAVVLYILGRRYPNQTMFEYSESILGKYMGKLAGIIFALFFMVMGSIMLRVLGDFLTTTLMPETPIVAFEIIFLLVSAYAVKSGLEVVARLSELIGPVLILSLLAVDLFNVKWVQLERLQPMFQHTPAQIVKASLLPGSWFGVCIAMGVFMAYHNKPQETLKVKLAAVVTGVFLLTLTLLEAITVLGYELCTRQLYVVFRLAQMTQVGDFIERLEFLEVLIWLGGGFISITILFYQSTLGFAQVLKLKKYQPLLPFVGVTIFVLSLILFHGVTDRVNFLEGSFPYFALSVEGLLTTILLMISFLRHGKLKKQ